jgi:uncharacterized membrane protein HdeD (DUF308 family)
MLEITRNWWTLALRGVVALAFGVLAFIWPGLTVTILVALFGAYALVDGIVAAVVGLRGRQWALLAEGLLGIVAGVLTFLWPAITALVLLFLIAAWAIITGAAEILAAVWLRRLIVNEWLLILGGAASVLLGILLVAFPSTGILALVWLLAAYAIVYGALLLALGLRLRGLGRRLASGRAAEQASR